jgi:hypothetical protein
MASAAPESSEKITPTTGGGDSDVDMEDQDEARLTRRLRREKVKEDSMDEEVLDDTLLDDVDGEEDGGEILDREEDSAAAGDLAAVTTNTTGSTESDASAEQPDPLPGTSGKKPIVFEIPKVVIDIITVTGQSAANPSGANDISSFGTANPSGANADNPNPSGGVALPGQCENTNSAYKSVSSLRNTTHINPSVMGGNLVLVKTSS